MVVVIVSGPPASGKTVLADRLANSLHLPVFSRDTIKERLFDTLGCGNRAWSAKLGATSYEIFLGIAQSLFAARQACILETNFTARAAARLQELAVLHDATLVRVSCSAQLDQLKERFSQRLLAGERHPGHVDADRLAHDGDTLFAAVSLDLAGPLIAVDTTDFATVDYDALAENVAAQIRTRRDATRQVVNHLDGHAPSCP